MINLITSYFKSENTERQAELDTCLRRNIDNKSFDSLTVLIDQYPMKLDGNCNMVYIHERPTFDAFFHFAKPNQWNVVCNSDIYFDETIRLLNGRGKSEFLALCRYDVLKNGEVKFLNRRDAQDAWCFFGKPKDKLKAMFYQGVPGCDNVLARIAKQSGYTVLNPSLTIKCYHLHNSNERSYTQHDKLPPPYELITPHT
jgi:hypothetical protein